MSPPTRDLGRYVCSTRRTALTHIAERRDKFWLATAGGITDRFASAVEPAC